MKAIMLEKMRSEIEGMEKALRNSQLAKGQEQGGNDGTD